IRKGRDRFFAGIEKIGNEALILHPLVALTHLDIVIVGRREFRVLECKIGISQERLPRTRVAIAAADFVDLKQDRHETEQGYGCLRHLRQRPEFLPPEDAWLRHQTTPPRPCGRDRVRLDRPDPPCANSGRSAVRSRDGNARSNPGSAMRRRRPARKWCDPRPVWSLP